MIVMGEAPLCHASLVITAGSCPEGPGFLRADAGGHEQQLLMAAIVNSAQGRDGSAPLQRIELHPFPPASLQDIELEPSSAARPRASSACSPIVRANMLFRWDAALRP